MKKQLLFIQIIFFLIASLFVSTPTWSCPRTGSEMLTDVNCDLVGKVSIAGDSIVFGVGDSVNGGKGGFTKRLDNAFNGNVTNLGKPGATVKQFQRILSKRLRKPTSSFYTKIIEADIVIFYLITNNYWDRLPVSFAIRDMRKLVKFTRKKLKEINSSGIPPEIFVSTLNITDRDFQIKYIQEANKQLMKYKSKNLPTQIFFHRIKRMKYEDQLHPSSSGYDKMAAYLIRRFSKLSTFAEKKFPDDDLDNIYNFFEINKYGTDPSLFDTDGDGIGDGTELFENATNPLDFYSK